MQMNFPDLAHARPEPHAVGTRGSWVVSSAASLAKHLRSEDFAGDVGDHAAQVADVSVGIEHAGLLVVAGP